MEKSVIKWGKVVELLFIIDIFVQVVQNYPYNKCLFS